MPHPTRPAAASAPPLFLGVGTRDSPRHDFSGVGIRCCHGSIDCGYGACQQQGSLRRDSVDNVESATALSARLICSFRIVGASRRFHVRKRLYSMGHPVNIPYRRVTPHLGSHRHVRRMVRRAFSTASVAMSDGVSVDACAGGSAAPHRLVELPARRSFVAQAPIVATAPAWVGIPMIVPPEPGARGVFLFRRRNLLICMALVLCACHRDRYWPMTPPENVAAAVAGIHVVLPPTVVRQEAGTGSSCVSRETPVAPASTRRRELLAAGIQAHQVF